MNAAGSAEGLTIAKERTRYGRWIWFFSGPSGERERTHEDVALPGPSEVQQL